MLPIIFEEQLKVSSTPESKHITLSLENYKIDYNDFLGEGDFGKVYGVVKRPENEKTFFARWFPYQYDSLFRVSSTDKQSTKWCIKISKSFLTIAASEIAKGNDLFLAPSIGSFFEKKEQFSSNQIRQKHRITNIVFPETSEYCAQFKTRIKGKTLQFHIDNTNFSDPKNYLLRRAYVFFIWTINNVRLNVEDLHFNNLMYDETSQQIEIVDGSTRETMGDKGYNRVFTPYIHDSKQAEILTALSQIAEDGVPYTKKFDKCLLNKIKDKEPKAQEFHNTKDFAKYTRAFSRTSHINALREGRNIFNLFHRQSSTKQLSAEEKADNIIHKPIHSYLK